MTGRLAITRDARGGRLVGYCVTALLLSGCAIQGKRKTDREADGYPPIDPSSKYFKPGPVLATPDSTELERRFAYHQKVIDAYGFSYTIQKTPPTQRELSQSVGFHRPPDVGTEKPKKLPTAWNMKLPPKWDWRSQGVGMPPIRQQGGCGSCWAFGTTAALEGSIAALDKKIVDLSEQQVLDCSGHGTCGGGYWAYSLYKNKGAVWEKDYPYKGYDQYCKQGMQYPYKIESYHGVQNGDIDAIKAAIHKYGAVGVTMAVCGSIPGYSGGVYDSSECNYMGTNHIVALVGWDDTVKHKKGSGVWVLRNSWGTGWGDGGYAQWAYGMASIEEDATYVIYQPEDPTDTDMDGVRDVNDNCKTTPNPDQLDADQDGQGDACDSHFDPFEATVSMSDDDSRKLELGFSFPFYGTNYPEVYLNSDGNLTFGASDNKTTPRDKNRFLTAAPRIAPFFADMNPSGGGKVKWGKSAPNEVFFRYEQVKRFDNDGTATATVTLRANGEIVIAYGSVTGPSYVVGVSKGGAGNGATESALGQGSFGYGGTNAVYQVFNASNPFSLSNATVTFTPGMGPNPNPNPNPQPPGEKGIVLGDDSQAAIPLGFSMPFFGQSYNTVYVNSDGNLTFGKGDGVTANRDENRFLSGAPRIAALYSDLDPSAGGAVTYLNKDASTTVVSFKGVPRYGSQAGNNVTITLHADGLIDLSYGQVQGSSYIVGISKGGSGNSGSKQQLGSLMQPIGYGGKDTIYQVFTKAEAFTLTGKTISFTTAGGVMPNPSTETFVTLGDDSEASIPLGFSFPFFGQSYNNAYVNSDGNVTFGQGDGVTANRTVSRFLSGAPRIALLYSDLDPSSGGTVSYRKDKPSEITIGYKSVPIWGSSGDNTVKVTLDSSGKIVIAYEGVSLPYAVVGVSQGGQGNWGSAQSLLSLTQSSSSYTNNGAIYGVLDGNASSLIGKTMTFSP